MKKFIWEELPPKVEGNKSYTRFILRIRGNMEFVIFENEEHIFRVGLRFYLNHDQYADSKSTDMTVSLRMTDNITEAMTWCEQWIASLVPQIGDVTYQTTREIWYRN